MHTIKIVSFDEKEVEIREKEMKTKKRVVDAYDMEDPFYQEDEAVATFECKYKNFFCLSGESLVERKKEEKEEKAKKEKKETSRERYLKQKQEKLEEYTAAPEDADRIIKELVTLEILTAQEPSRDTLLDEIVKVKPGEDREKTGAKIDELMSKEGLQNLLKEAEEECKKIVGEIEVEIKKKIEESAEKETVDESSKITQLSFDDDFLEKLTKYTEIEYLCFFIKLFLAGKKRILEHKVKKNIVKMLQEVFPVEYRSSSLGKKIASYVIKKRRSEQSKESQSEENMDSNSNTEDETPDTPIKTTKTEESLNPNEEAASNIENISSIGSPSEKSSIAEELEHVSDEKLELPSKTETDDASGNNALKSLQKSAPLKKPPVQRKRKIPLPKNKEEKAVTSPNGDADDNTAENTAAEDEDDIKAAPIPEELKSAEEPIDTLPEDVTDTPRKLQPVSGKKVPKKTKATAPKPVKAKAKETRKNNKRQKEAAAPSSDINSTNDAKEEEPVADKAAEEKEESFSQYDTISI
ncbi:hypothetical protein NEMIN01_0824 [Nematocida minor]|uniref:uncharacterized protein n=1 Tax=Nematocida minor TaxID=1912983 RepID=UPI00221F9DF6|nr:uncharacterized protein NEMIN01_0824 [Nematocida minor]KAI5190039.1 hypothetical protein NEMIN01_0824 [Nematocida minor]